MPNSMGFLAYPVLLGQRMVMKAKPVVQWHSTLLIGGGGEAGVSRHYTPINTATVYSNVNFVLVELFGSIFAHGSDWSHFFVLIR